MVRRSLKEEGFAAIAAIQFLTRLPIPVVVPFEPRVLARSVAYFPLAGLAIGVLTAGLAWLLSFVLPLWPASILTLAVWLGLSGGLHLDGWMDTADGVLSHRSRERMLDIMKDSRVGAMGAAAAILLLMLKASLLVELMGYGITALLPALITASCFGRTAMALAIVGWPPARKTEGLGSLFNGVNKRRAAVCYVLSVAFCYIMLNVNGINEIISLSSSLVASLFMSLIVWGFGGWLARKLGGLTGDTYGAINEAVEAAMLILAVVGVRLWP
jgi:adenosylcobinamide-GDP ribazoletransferase